MMVDLPLDIWLHVAHFLSQRSLEAMLGVSRMFYNLAMNERYKVVELQYYSDCLLQVLNRIKRPLAAQRVQILHIQDPIVHYTVNEQKGVYSCYLRARDFINTYLKRSKLDTYPYPRKKLDQSLAKSIASLHQVTEYRLDWETINTRSLSPVKASFLPVAWHSFGGNLRKLTLMIARPNVRRLFTEAPPNSLPKLEDLTLTMGSLRGFFIVSDFPSASDLTEDSLADILLPFISGLSSTLRSLALSAHDVNNDWETLLDGLDCLPHLARFSLLLPFLQYQPTRPLAVAHFIQRHSATLSHLTLDGVECWPRDFDMPVLTLPILPHLTAPLPALRALEVYFPLVADSASDAIHALVPLLPTLTELVFHGGYFLPPSDLPVLLTAFVTHRAELTRLKIYMELLTPDVVDLLAWSLPGLRRLEIYAHTSSAHAEPPAPGSGPQPINFCEAMRDRRYPDWALVDLQVIVYALGADDIRRAIALCVPGLNTAAPDSTSILVER